MNKDQIEQVKQMFSAFVAACDDMNEQEFYVTPRMMASIVQDSFEKWMSEQVNEVSE